MSLPYTSNYQIFPGGKPLRLDWVDFGQILEAQEGSGLALCTAEVRYGATRPAAAHNLRPGRMEGPDHRREVLPAVGRSATAGGAGGAEDVGKLSRIDSANRQ